MSVAGIEPIAEPNLQNSEAQLKPEIAERVWGLDVRVDPSVTFEEYVYWAKIERAEEHEANLQYVEERGPLTVGKVIHARFSKGIHYENRKKEKERAAQVDQAVSNGSGRENETAGEVAVAVNDSLSMSVSPEEWKTASRALRTAGWGTIFYLITTDILGYSSTP
jgi:hypothetical protein